MRLRQPKHDSIETALLTIFVFCFTFFVLGLVFNAVASGAEADCYRATCRIEMGDRSGSGCVFQADDERFYILTNAHVAGTTRGSQARVVFNREGHEGSVPAMTEWGVLGSGNPAVPDVAVVSVLRANLGGYEPPIIPLSSQRKLEVGETLFSVGAPKGGWLTGWTGHVTDDGGETFRFTPRPHHGRSGSPIFNSSGTEIIGLLTWDIENVGVGQAQSIATVLQAMQASPPVLRAADLQGGGTLAPVQICPDGNCPNGSCPNGMCPPQSRPSAPTGRDPWPNFRRTPPAVEKTEPATPAPKGCDCDLSGLACKCDGKEVAALQEVIAALVVKVGEQGGTLVDLSKRLDGLSIQVEGNTAIAIDLSTRIDGIKTGGNAIVRVEPSPDIPGMLILHYEDGSVADVQLPPIRVRQIDRDGNVVTNEQGQREEMNVWLGQNLNLRYRNVDDAQVEALEDRVRDLEAR